MDSQMVEKLVNSMVAMMVYSLELPTELRMVEHSVCTMVYQMDYRMGIPMVGLKAKQMDSRMVEQSV